MDSNNEFPPLRLLTRKKIHSLGVINVEAHAALFRIASTIVIHTWQVEQNVNEAEREARTPCPMKTPQTPHDVRNTYSRKDGEKEQSYILLRLEAKTSPSRITPASAVL